MYEYIHSMSKMKTLTTTPEISSRFGIVIGIIILEGHLGILRWVLGSRHGNCLRPSLLPGTELFRWVYLSHVDEKKGPC